MKVNELFDLTENMQTMPEFHTEKTANGWYATDSNSYDGAEDGNMQTGQGNTPQEAILDLCDELLAAGLYDERDLALAVEREGMFGDSDAALERSTGTQDEQPRADYQ